MLGSPHTVLIAGVWLNIRLNVTRQWQTVGGEGVSKSRYQDDCVLSCVL